MAIVNHGIDTGNAGAGNSGQGFLLSLGAEGAEVKKWQEYLMSQGYGVSANGVFDKSTQLATRTWQTRNGFARTGSVNADAYALAGLKVGVAADIDTSAGITDSINHDDTTSPAETKEPEKTEAAAPPPPTTTTALATPSSETEKKEEPQVPPQLRDPNPQLTETTPTYGNDYVNGDSKAEDPKQDLPPQLVDPKPDLGEKNETAEENLPPQVVDPNPELSGNATYGGDYVNADAPKTEDPAAKLPPQLVDPNPSLDKNQTTAPEDPKQNLPPQLVDPNPDLPKGEVPTPNNTTQAPAVNLPPQSRDPNPELSNVAPTTPTTQTNGVASGAMAGAMAGAGTSSVPDNNPTRVEETKAPPMNYEEFLKSETETSGTSEVTKANDKETADVLAGLDQKANEVNNPPVKESLSESKTEASTGKTSTPANNGQEETPAVYGNTDEDYVPGTTMTWAEYFAQQENANSANSNGSTNESGTTNEDTTTDTPVDINKLDPDQNEVDPNQYGGNTTDSGNGDPYASDNNPFREDSQYSDFVNEDSKEDTSTDKPTEDTKTESKEETSNADVLAGLAKIRDDGYKLAEETKKNAEAAAIGAYERAITEAETEREKSVIDARNAAAQRRADYGANAEALANMGLKSSGYSAYLDQQSYETERAETQAANALADYNKRMAGYAKEDADRIAAENYAKSIYDIDTTYQTNLLAADDRASAKDRQTASDFRTILADVGSGAYTKEQALQLARDLGLSEEQIRAIEGAADEYTASVEEAERAEQEAEDKEHQALVDGYKAMVTPDTTDEDIESLKEVGLTQEDVDALKAERNSKIVSTIDSYISSGDFESFVGAIEAAYSAKIIDQSEYQEKYYDAMTGQIKGINNDGDLSDFMKEISDLEKDHKIAERHTKALREAIIKKYASYSPDFVAKLINGEHNFEMPDGTYYPIDKKIRVDENVSTILNQASGNVEKEGSVVVFNGNVYYKDSDKWLRIEFYYDKIKEAVVNQIKAKSAQKNQDIPLNNVAIEDPLVLNSFDTLQQWITKNGLREGDRARWFQGAPAEILALYQNLPQEYRALLKGVS